MPQQNENAHHEQLWPNFISYLKASYSVDRYDTSFDEDDVLHGAFTVSIGNNFLENKFDWTSGESSMDDVMETNKRLKASTGGCPMLHMGHSRTDDFESPELVKNSMKRYNWFSRYVQEKQLGVLQGPKDIVDKSKE
jgi:hypothetical protein